MVSSSLTGIGRNPSCTLTWRNRARGRSRVFLFLKLKPCNRPAYDLVPTRISRAKRDTLEAAVRARDAALLEGAQASGD
jgi:hypothetical protein